jgi:hypothetical protein
MPSEQWGHRPMFPTVFLISWFKELVMVHKVLLAALLVFLYLSLAAIDKAVVRIENPTNQTVEYFTQSGYDIAAVFPGRWLDLVIPVDAIDALRQDYPQLLVTQTEGELKANLRSSDRVLPGYRSYSQMMAELNTLATQHSDIMTLVTLGTGWGAQYYADGYNNYADYNHEIVAVKVSGNPTQDEDEPALFFCGAHHAREPLSVETTMSVLLDVLTSYGSDTFITDIVDNTAIWFVPMLNPDGHKVVWDQLDVWWRKNIRDNNNNHTFSTDNYYGSGNDGVDLNRNYGFSWGYMSASDAINSVTYHGPEAFSEPETQLFRDLLTAHPFVAGISYHTYSELVLYPYGYIGNISAPDVQELSALAIEMAELIQADNGGHYTPQPSWALYPASGGLDDWAYGARGIFSYTVELGTSFIPNATTAASIAQRIRPAGRKLMERVTKSMLTGHVYDAVTRTPIVATVYVEGIDNSPVNRAPYRSQMPYGRYYRLLPPGDWNVRIYAEGYLPLDAMVTISDTEVTVLDAELFSVGQETLTVRITTFGEVPVQGASLEFLNTDYEAMISDADGYIVIPDFNLGYYDMRVSKPGFETIFTSYAITEPYLVFLFSDYPYISYDFEASLSGWTTNGGWGLSTQQSYNGAKSLADSPTGNYLNNVDSYAKLAAPVNLSSFVNVSLSFYVKSSIWQDGDYCALEFSTDNNNWNTLDYYDGSFAWTQKTYNLNGLIGQQLYLRFHMVTNNYQSMDGIYIDDFRIYGSGVVSNPEEYQAPIVSSLTIYPNPFSDVAKLSVSIDTKNSARAELDIYNIKGQKVASLLNKYLTKGNHAVEWNGCDSSGNKAGSGVYYAVLRLNGEKSQARKLMLIK